MLFYKPMPIALLNFPATVTVPGFEGCVNCLWLPRVRSRYQPSRWSSRMTSRTFGGTPPSLGDGLRSRRLDPQTERVRLFAAGDDE